MRAPFVTCVLLTTHPRRAGFLPDALRSYRAQTYAARELVVINDGPVQLAPRAPDVRVVNLPTLHPTGRAWTLGEKRNVGLRVARGAWIATWDDDDVSLPERIAAEVRFALNTGADYVLGDRAYIADASLDLKGCCYRGASFPVMATALIRRNCAVAAGGYPLRDYCEDAALLERVRLCQRGNVVTMPGADWYVMRRHDANITLGFGETSDAWISCALRDPVRDDVQRAVDALRRGPGEDDLQEVTR